MAEKLPETNVAEPDSTTDEKGETGIGTATSESAVETSEDHGPEPAESQESLPVTKTRQKKGKSSKEVAEGDSKLERSVSRSPDKAPRTRSRKFTSEKGADVSKESDQKTALEGSPDKDATTSPETEDKTPPRSKSPSILMRLRSHSKLRSASVPPEGSAKADDLRGKAKVEKSSEIYSPAKRRGLGRKTKSVEVRERTKSTSRSEPLDTNEAEPNLEEIGEKELKTKSKASVKPKLPPTEQEETDSPTVEEPQQTGENKSLDTTCSQVSSGIQSIHLSKTENDDAVPLLSLDESMDTTSSGAPGKEEIGTGGATKVEEIGAGGAAASHWKPQHSHQEGGFQKDAIRAQLSSSSDDVVTEVSLVSPSSAIKVDSEMKKGLSTSTDTLSEIPGLKEDEVSGGQEQTKMSPPQGQKRVKGKESSDSDDEYKAVSGSPVKKVASESKS